jgi:hypothetical protein
MNELNARHLLEFSDSRIITETQGNVFPEAWTLAEAFMRRDAANDVPRHIVETLYGTAFAELHDVAKRRTHRLVDPHKLYNLWRLRYRAPSGPSCEAGVFRGASALVMDATIRDQGELHLVDSFEGFAEACVADACWSDGKEALVAWGDFAWDADQVRALVPRAHVHKGWIPEVLESLPDQQWAFVHLDLDMYEPTYHAAKYFLPRMVQGGIILEDDYASVPYPGAGRAWAAVGCELMALPTGQGVFIA